MATNSCYTCTFASKCLRWYFTPDCSPHASWSHPIKVPCVWCWWQRVGPGHRQVNLHSACIGFFNLQSQPFIYREIRYTVLLNKKIPLPSDTRKEEEVCESWREWRKFYNLFEMLWSLLYIKKSRKSELATSYNTNKFQSSLAPFVDKKESDRETIFYINNLPKPGLYKAQIFARRKPKKRGKLIIPLVACILLEYRNVRIFTWYLKWKLHWGHVRMTSVEFLGFLTTPLPLLEFIV